MGRLLSVSDITYYAASILRGNPPTDSFFSNAVLVLLQTFGPLLLTYVEQANSTRDIGWHPKLQFGY